MSDPTESIRKELLVKINAEPGSREALEAQHGQVWDTNQLREDFEVLGFGAPLVVVRQKFDGQKGSLFFQHSPRLPGPNLRPFPREFPGPTATAMQNGLQMGKGATYEQRTHRVASIPIVRCQEERQGLVGPMPSSR